MKTPIAILGTGSVGKTLAENLIKNGYTVFMGTRDVAATLASGPEKKFNDWYSQYQTQITLKTFSEACNSAKIIFNALSGSAVIPVFQQIPKNYLKEKILIDVSNPLDFSKGFPPGLMLDYNNFYSMAEALQELLPETFVVKTLNTMWCGLMLNPQLIAGEQHVNFICGNDDASKQQVLQLLSDFGWNKQQHLDLGNITNARGTEAYLLLWTRIYAAGKNGSFNITISNSPN